MNFDLASLKMNAAVGILAAVIVPKILYFTSNSYIRVHNMSSAYVSGVTNKALGIIGLQPVVDDKNLEAIIQQEAPKFGVDPRMGIALVKHESANNSDAYSLKGAIGVGQIMPANAKRCGYSKVSELWDKRKNIRCMLQILSEELVTYKGNFRNALRAYNGGPKCVPRKRGDKTCHESENHSAEVLSIFASLV